MAETGSLFILIGGLCSFCGGSDEEKPDDKKIDARGRSCTARRGIGAEAVAFTSCRQCCKTVDLSFWPIDIKSKNRLRKVCYVPTPAPHF